MPVASRLKNSRKKSLTKEVISQEVSVPQSNNLALFSTFINTLMVFLTSIQFAIIIGALLISFSIIMSSGISKNVSSNTLGVANNLPEPSLAPVAPNDDLLPGKLSIDDDPIMGEKSAKLTMIEFSDYECPFCKRYFTETYPTLKSDYIDSGKVKLVFRDLPLSFHQNAPKEAEAANCAREQGGDVAYFKYHDEMFAKTTSNGTGLSLDQLPTLAGDIGLNIAEFQTCLDSGKYQSEVSKDMADAANVAATGTPTFFFMKGSTSDFSWDKAVADSTSPKSVFHLFDGDKEIGVKIVGAQALTTFKTQIEKQLTN